MCEKVSLHGGGRRRTRSRRLVWHVSTRETDDVDSPNVSTVILGASKPQQVHDNCKALQLLPKLTDSVMEEIEGILQNKPKAAL